MTICTIGLKLGAEGMVRCGVIADALLHTRPLFEIVHNYSHHDDSDTNKLCRRHRSRRFSTSLTQTAAAQLTVARYFPITPLPSPNLLLQNNSATCCFAVPCSLSCAAILPSTREHYDKYVLYCISKVGCNSRGKLQP